MKLNTDRLNAFFEVATEKHFHRAADNLCITQSALSQRIMKLEQELKTSLLVRESRGILLTEAGDMLFEYILKLQLNENELLESIFRRTNAESCIVKIASFSSVLRSVIIPSLQPIIRENSDMNIEFFSRELRDLPNMLETGEVDFIISDDAINSDNYEAIQIGSEVMEHIQCNSPSLINNKNKTIFLDHDAEDKTTYNFFRVQGEPNKELERRFYDDVYGILDGVKLGFGEAIISKHMIPNDNSVKIISHKNIVQSPVVLNFKKNRPFSSLEKKIIDTLIKQTPKYLQV